MATNAIELGCDVTQGFNFRKDVQAQIGFVRSLKIGEVELKADLTLKDPENNQTDTKVVGVAHSIGWSVSTTDPVFVSLQVGEEAKNKIDTLTKKNMSNIEVEMIFDCYTYDPADKKYFKNFHTKEAALKGLIFGQGDDLAIQMGLEPAYEVQEPRNYTLNIAIKPQAKAQEIHYASSVTDKLALAWGVTNA
jgi:predicted nuclease of predicted toxin-antitoxin system